MDPETASAAGALRCPPEGTWVGAPQPLVVDWLQVLVENTVSVLPEFATNTFPADESSAMASGPDPVETEPIVAKSDLLLLLPSLSTLTVPLAWLAM